jgi:hypothetical protein
METLRREVENRRVGERTGWEKGDRNERRL